MSNFEVIKVDSIPYVGYWISYTKCNPDNFAIDNGDIVLVRFSNGTVHYAYWKNHYFWNLNWTQLDDKYISHFSLKPSRNIDDD